MLARTMLSLTLIFGLATVGTAQDKKEKKAAKEKTTAKKKSDDLNDRVLDQVKRALGKFEKELGKKKVDAILGQVKRGLHGAQAAQLRWNMDELKIDPGTLHERLLLHKGLRGVRIVQDLTDLKGAKERRMLGVMLHAEDDSPVKVKQVMNDSAAEQAGLKAGDVIVKVNGKKVDDPKSLSDTVQKSKGKVKISVKRGKKDMVIEVEPKMVKGQGIAQALIELDDIEIPHVIQGKQLKGIDGQGIIDLNDEIFKKLELPKGAKGIIQLKPGKGEQRIELRIEDKDGKREIHRKIIEAHSKDKSESSKSAMPRKIERRIEVKSDLGEVLEKLQMQMKELQAEIKELKKAKK